MKVKHTLSITAKCPLDQKPDVYRCVVYASELVKVETILEEAAKLTRDPVFQEDLTWQLHRALACTVKTVGYHSGVKTVVTCP